MLKGYRTLIANVGLLAFSVATAFGFVVPEDEKQAIILGITAIVGLVIRFDTDGPVGGSYPDI